MERSRNIAIALAASALVAGVVVFIITRSGSNGGGTLGLAFPIVLVALIAFVLLAIVLIRGRAIGGGGLLRGLTGGLFGSGKFSKTDQARDLGFSYEPKGETAFRRSFSDLPGIPDGGKAKHVMRGSIGDRQSVIFQHTYLVYNGTMMMAINHTIFSTAAPRWPPVSIAPRSLLSRLAERFGWESGFHLENAEFNNRFKVKTDNEDFALMLLSAEMQHFILDKPGVWWNIKPGRLCLIYNGPLRFGRLDTSISRIERFWSLVPDELEDFVSS